MHWALQLLTICTVILSQIVMAQVERKLITFNAALQFSIPMKGLRRWNLMMGLKTSDADVVCLQEVYDGSDVNWLTMRLRNEFPFSISFSQRMVNIFTKELHCKDAKVFESLKCMMSHCSGYNTSDENGIVYLLRCLQQQCEKEVFNMPQVCLTCFFLFPNSTEAFNVCLNPETKINVPGLLLLSKHKLLTSTTKWNHAGVVEIAKQGYLVANIETIGTVVCTHLATSFLGNFYPEASLSYGSYVVQNRVEVGKLLIAFNDTKPLILAGDFNAGPEGVCGYNPDSYRVLTSPIVNLEHTILDKCTFCNDNTWNKQECDWTIDHVFLRGLTLKGIKRIFDVPIVKKQMKRYHVSDHYGVMATFVVDQF